MQEPLVGFILVVDFNINQHAPAEERGAMFDTSLCEPESSRQTSETESLQKRNCLA